MGKFWGCLFMAASFSLGAQETATPPRSLPAYTIPEVLLRDHPTDRFPTEGSYVLNLTREQMVFLDQPKTLPDNTKSFFYHVVKGNTPTLMQMLHTTANCATKQLKISTTTTVSLDPPKVLDYEVVDKGWVNLEPEGVDQAVFNYVCFNEVTTGYTLKARTGQMTVMYYNYLQQKK